MTPRNLTLEEIYSASAPKLGVSGTLPPMADVNFKQLFLQVSPGYDIPGVGAGGQAVLPIGGWKSRGGGSPEYVPAAPSGVNGSWNY